MPSSVPKIRYWSIRKIIIKSSIGFNKMCLFIVCVCVPCLLNKAVPLVSGWIHDVAQLIFSGQPSNTLEKQAPIWNEKATRLRTGSLWLSEALKCQPGFNELELSWAEATTKQKALWTPNIYRMYGSSADKSLITVSMKPGQQRREKTVWDKADHSLTSTLGVGGKPLIAGF